MQRTESPPIHDAATLRITPEIEAQWRAEAESIQRDLLSAAIAGDTAALEVAEARARELATTTERRMGSKQR